MSDNQSNNANVAEASSSNGAEKQENTNDKPNNVNEAVGQDVITIAKVEEIAKQVVGNFFNNFQISKASEDDPKKVEGSNDEKEDEKEEWLL